MEAKVFWGKQGEFGPFTCQGDGWPCAGEVIRHYRRLRQMSAETLARRYREELVKHFGNENEPKTYDSPFAPSNTAALHGDTLLMETPGPPRPSGRKGRREVVLDARTTGLA